MNPVSKCARGMNKQLLKTSVTDVLSSRKKLRKTLRGGDPPPPLPLYVRGLKDCTDLFKLLLRSFFRQPKYLFRFNISFSM